MAEVSPEAWERAKKKMKPMTIRRPRQRGKKECPHKTRVHSPIGVFCSDCGSYLKGESCDSN